ncbi:MAG: DUF429 domain-containing protein [Acidimicrobiaceae bacterium]|nr:DUF429 domain-containing protein [Acidimicrobiaceae bacterium]MYB86843.1 DUF429 domain-containing protein [Acidimicrobiaceae bacterium]MYH92312.1 DUF429 domain-containing protein [Acidimicrobiaceae bacterium]
MVERAMNDMGANPVRIFHGIDFSGDVTRWTPGCGRFNMNRCNVWIATAEARADALVLVDLRPVQHLSGGEHPFERLVALLANGDYCAAGIDAPFSLPERHMPVGGWRALLRDVATFPKGGRPFPEGEELVAYAERNAPLAGRRQPLRKTERTWADRGLSVRSTLFNENRGGAPFTVACLTLLAKVERPVWPWAREDRGLLVEAFPACQLLHWRLPYSGYANSYPCPEREAILERVSERISMPKGLHEHCRYSADALDAVLCLFAAKAAFDGLATVDDSLAAEHEGWISTHPV